MKKVDFLGGSIYIYSISSYHQHIALSLGISSSSFLSVNFRDHHPSISQHRKPRLWSLLPRAQGLLHLWPRRDHGLPPKESAATNDPIA